MFVDALKAQKSVFVKKKNLPESINFDPERSDIVF